MEKVNKGVLGGYSKSKSSDDFTHVIFTEDEYKDNQLKIRDLKDNITKLEKGIEGLHEDYKFKFGNYKNSAEDEIKKIQKQAKEEVAEANERADSFEDKNKHLIQRVIEKANAVRELTPKKQHTGYVFLSVEQFTFHCECLVSGKTSKKTVLKLPCFRVRMQSPYDISFNFKNIKDFVYDDIYKNIGDEMGLNATYRDFMGYDEDEIRKIWADDENFLFKISHKAVFQNKNFWEVEFLTRDMPLISPSMIDKNKSD